VWNRVVLLAAGVASGWTLVHLLTASPGQAPTHRWRLAAGLTVGGGLIGLLAAASFEAALAGFLVFAFSALVAYAANAKQVSKVPDPVLPRRPSLALAIDPRTQVVIVALGEPATYDGPQYWAQAYKERQARGERIPHWFLRPWAYARIRAAYAAMGGLHPLDVALGKASEALQATLGPGYCVRHAYLRSHPYLVRALVALAEEGFRRLIIVPLGAAAHAPAAASATRALDPALHQAVVDSRVREVGVQVTYTASPEEPPGRADLYADHLPLLERGHPPDIVPDAAAAQVQDLADLVSRASRAT